LAMVLSEPSLALALALVAVPSSGAKGVVPGSCAKRVVGSCSRF